MTAQHTKPQRTWTVAEAQARLPEILRLAAEEGPQRIGAERVFRDRGRAPAAGFQHRRANPWASGWSRTCRAGLNLEIPRR